MKLTEMLSFSPEQFKETFLSPENREVNYEHLYAMFDALSTDALEESPLSEASGLLTIEELVDVVIFFLKKSYEERMASERKGDTSYRCIWRFIQMYYMSHHGSQKLVVEGVPIAFDTFRNMDLRELYHIMKISDESNDAGRPACIYLHLFKPELELYDHAFVKELQKVALEEIEEYLNSLVVEEGAPRELMDKHLEEMKERVNDPEFHGMVYVSLGRKERDPISSMLGDLLFGSNRRKRESLDEFFDEVTREKKEEEPTKH